MSTISADRLDRAYQTALAALLAERTLEGHWVGELSASALSTAAAVSALALVQRERQPPRPHDRLIADGLRWLTEHQNEDGGWGDTIRSISNISTSMLCRAAFYLCERTEVHAASVRRVEQYLSERFGATPQQLAESVRKRYGKDRTFAVPILTTCAIAGLVDWEEVESLPFELACLPQQWYRLVKLHVVSYALPALIAVGQAIYYHRPPRNPLAWLMRRLSLNRSLAVLESIQPESGGFLEATPLTSFVVLSLASIGHEKHTVARHGVQFLVDSVRPDGSWPIDTNLSTWVTTLSINALAAAGELPHLERKSGLRSWLMRQQYKTRHPYTGAEPGGWAWTPLTGGVPDADDTPGALIALSHLIEPVADEEPQPSPRALGRATLGEYTAGGLTLPRLPDLSWEDRPALLNGLRWLLDLQNRDGGWPTFCRGWGHLPFDRSGCDLTAHVLRAVSAWQAQLEADQVYAEALRLARQTATFPGFPLPDATDAVEQGLKYLAREQRPDGSWLPLWFGNQHAPNDENPTYGTARVLAAYRDLGLLHVEQARRGFDWLLANQNPDGGWGGMNGSPSSIEETALAVEVLLPVAKREGETPAEPPASAREEPRPPGAVDSAVNNGLAWLVEQVEAGGLAQATPIGFYFARLWYFEKLYPIMFTVAALGRARRSIPQAPATSPP